MVRGISKYTSEISDLLLDEGVIVHTLTMPEFFNRVPRSVQVILFILYQQLVLPIYALLKRPDFIFDAYNSYSLLAALRWRYLYVIHDFIPFSNKYWWLKPGSVYQRVLHKLSPLIPGLELYYINEIVAKEGSKFVNKFDGVIPNVVKPLRNLAENDVSALALIKEIRMMYPGRHVITTISGNGKNKDFNGFINLLNSSGKKVVVVVFGFESTEDSLSSDSVFCIYPGFVAAEFIGTAISNSDIFIFHSLQEGFGRPIIEALMEGVKVLSVGHIPAIQSVQNHLRPLLHLYDGPSDFVEKFNFVLGAEIPDIKNDDFQSANHGGIADIIFKDD